MVGEASAVFKEVELWGVRSINDMGSSDLLVSMDEIKKDYSGFLKTDGMSEFFHKDQAASPKTDMTEASAWLIDNGIINRDEQITVSNINGIPDVNISKFDMTDAMALPVQRSDALMYLYKATFGPLYGRTVGVETPNVRMHNGNQILFSNLIQMMSDWVPQDVEWGASGTTGAPGKGGSGVGLPGAPGGIGTNSADATNDANKWRYTPQGDEYTSIWGDTNVFISENHFNQESHGGDGGDGGHGVTGGSLNSGSGGDGGNGGTGNNYINYETDYKSIYFVPGADVLFYRTTDVAEMYIQALYSKGLLANDSAVRTDKFTNTFIPLTRDGAALASWSGYADPYIVNQSRLEHFRVESVQWVSLRDLLGSNFTVTNSNSTMSITRHNMFQSNTGYFATEDMTRMGVYKYIYTMVYANEKKLSDLERDIVNYKYGMQFDGYANDEDVEVLKYLIAKGILDFNGSTELNDLYGPIIWQDFIPILYRVANKDARLDFSVVQLTDSEQSWQAKGFYPQTVQVVENGAAGTVSIRMDNTWVRDQYEDHGDEHATVTPVAYSTLPAQTKVYASAAPSSGVVATRLSNRTNSSSTRPTAVRLGAGTSVGVGAVGLAATQLGVGAKATVGNGGQVVLLNTPKSTPTTTVGTLTYQVDQSGAMKLGAYFFDFKGAQYVSEGTLVDSFRQLLAQVDKCNYNQLADQSIEGIDTTNPKHLIVMYMLKNVYVISALQSDAGLYSQMDAVLTEWENNVPSSMSEQLKQARGWVEGGFRHALEAAKNITGVPYNIVYTMTNGSTTRTPAASGGLLQFAQNLKSVSFTIADTSTGSAVPYKYEYTGTAAIEPNAKIEDVVTAVNGSAVELTKRVPEAEAKQFSEEELQVKFTQQIGSSLIDNSSTAPEFNIYTTPTGEQAFVSWSSIEKAKQNASNTSNPIPIEKISERLLYNSQTDTYAYFADGKDAVALVGTEIVSGDPELGVAFKSGEGETATYYYHFAAIKALLNVGQENAVIGGVQSVAVAGKAVNNALTTMPLISESGVAEASVSGIRALISRDDAKDRANFAADSLYMQGASSNNTRWGDYLTLSQSNRVMNIISRRITYKADNTNYVAYAVVRFVPVDAEELGTTPVGSQTSLQDLLDAPGMAPADPAAKATWTANKDACNAYANWIYGTANRSYIETGYLKPEATLYVCNPSKEAVAPPSGIFSPLNAQQRAAVRMISLGKVANGAAMKIGTSLSTGIHNVPEYAASYWMASDCSIIVHADRVYAHSGLFPNLEVTRQNQQPVAKVRNSLVKTAAFAIGSTFKIGYASDTLKNGQDNPTATVIETTSDGMVRCQVGPLRGMPVSMGSSKFLFDAEVAENDVYSFSAYSTSGADSKDVLRSTFDELFKVMPEVKYLGIHKNPYLTAGKFSYTVFNGSTLSIYHNATDLKPTKTVGIPSADSSMTPRDYQDKLAQAMGVAKEAQSMKTVQAYIMVEFPAYQYKVFDGRLMRSSSSATEFISPSLFANLNDLIIDEIINSSNGAIPVNEIPHGSLLKLGNGYYHATGNSTAEKTFVGYSYLNSYIGKATVADAATSFASEFVRAGNQYINVSHFFQDFQVLSNKKTEAQINALKTVATETMTLDAQIKYSIDSQGNVGVIVNKVGENATGGGSNYAPITIKFSDGLMAYKISAPDATAPRYVLCSSAENAVSGCLSELPFFTDNILDAELADRTGTLSGATFKMNNLASRLTDAFMQEFGAAFRGDLITLIRMLVFLVICWLILASWVCYACRLGNLMPILDAIKHPSGNQQRGGIDLMKIFSLGTIGIDTEFGLGRFLIYNFILCCLVLLVMWTGNITIG